MRRPRPTRVSMPSAVAHADGGSVRYDASSPRSAPVFCTDGFHCGMLVSSTGSGHIGAPASFELPPASVFSNVGDANWGVVVRSPNQAAGAGFINVGGCFQTLAGSSGSAAAQQVNACEDMACPAACQDQSSCRSSVPTGSCGSSVSSAQSACGTNYGNFSSACSEAMPSNMVNILCGAGGAG